jgi:hypothetical protein
LPQFEAGEFRAGLDLEAVIDALYDPAFFRLLVGHGKLDKLGRSALPKSSSTAARRLWSGSCDPFRPIAQRIDQQGKANLGWRRLGCRVAVNWRVIRKVGEGIPGSSGRSS